MTTLSSIPCNPGAVARGKEVLDLCLHRRRKFKPHGIKLHLNPVKKRRVRVYAGRDLVHRLKHLEDVGDVTKRQNKRKVSGGRIDEGGFKRIVCDSFPRGAPSVKQVSEPLDDYALSEEIRESRDISAVGDRLFKRLGKCG